MPGLPETLGKRISRIVSLLERIDENIEALKNASIRREDVRVRSRQVAGVDILSLDGHLQKTMLVILRLGRGTAGEVASRTGRSRALESLYLNQLSQMGYVHRERVGRVVYFSVSR